MSIKNRLRVLEQRFQRVDPIVLEMENGETIELAGSPQRIIALAMREALAGGTLSRTTKLIKQSVKGSEPGGGGMIEFARALLNSPTDEPAEPAQPPEIEPQAKPEPDKIINISKGNN